MNRWDVVIVCCMLYVATVTLFEVSLIAQPHTALIAFNFAIDFLFLIDMSLQFFLGYWDHRLHMLIFDHRMIVNRWVTAREERRDTETVHA